MARMAAATKNTRKPNKIDSSD